ncbi:hypothetical protein [Paenibacillus senegalensis]|uniref:hypothetical protein n=1 Tax=Paenibacillus senegalensis TaxID=1465766 RepID=UPI00028842F3|nr:hypothetical protein [Paenibacillus senegalensis]
MSKQIKQLLDKIELPGELHERSKLGVMKAKAEMEMEWKPKSRRPIRRLRKSFLAAAAACLIIGGAWIMTEGGTRIVIAAQNAVETLITQIFGSKEQLKMMDPQITEVDIQQIEEDLQIARQALSDHEFVRYKELFSALQDYTEKINGAADGTKEINPDVLPPEEQRDYQATIEEIESFNAQIVERTKITLEEASQLAGYPIRRPSYLPDGHQLVAEEINPKEMFRFRDSSRSFVALEYRDMEYRNGEFGFRTVQQPINDEELAKWAFDRIESYTVDGYQLEFAQYKDSNVQGMRIRIPETDSSKSYEIVMIADLLPKEEMEQILLSMVKE